jgi:hypothetical protein
MSIVTSVRKLLAPAAIPVAVGLALAGLTSAQAAQAAPASAGSAAGPAAPGLHATARIALGSATGVVNDIVTEAPNGAVFYSRGSVVYVVDGNSAPKVALHAGKKVIALAANASELFVQTGLRVTAYRRSSGAALRHWTLTSPVTPITSAGLYAVAGTLWSWTDWATDRSGFEFAKVSRISVAGSAVATVATQAYPGDMAADSTGLYFEGQRGSSGYLGHATPSGVVRRVKKPATFLNAPLALAGGRVNLLSFGTHVYISSYRAATLALAFSKRVSASDRSIAGTVLGLLVLAQPCSGISCSSASISKLNAATGSTTGALGVPHAQLLLAGPSAGVIEVSHGTLYLVRVGP